MKFFENSLSTLAARLFILLWILITVAALFQMQRLWWNRERVWYLGKSINEQRINVFKWAGIPSETLKDFIEIDTFWPMNIHYKAKGDHNTLSYGTYLLIPRIPSGSTSYAISVKGSKVLYQGVSSSTPVNRTYPEKPNVFGLIISVCCVVGIAFNIRWLWSLWSLSPISVPEMIGISCFLLMSSTLISMGVFESPGIGFKLYAWGGVAGWVSFLYNQLRKITIGFDLKKAFYGLIDFKKYLNISIVKSVLISKLFYFQKKSNLTFSLLLYSIGFFISLWAMEMAVVTVPDDWDAWAIWGAKAKVLALTEGALKNVIYFGASDYPLLWPTVWAFSGWCSGGWEEHWSRGWSVLFMLLTAWEIGVIIQRQTRQNKYALFGAIFFLSIPMVPLVASWSYAETALSLMIICSFGCLLRWRDENTINSMVLASIFAVGAAYTKNEGFLFAVLGFLWALAFYNKLRMKTVCCYMVCCLFLYAPWYLWTRVVLDLESNATKVITYHPGVILNAIKRIPDALMIIGNMWMDIKQWNVAMGLIGLVVAVYFVKGNKYQRIDMLLPLAMLSGYIFIIIHHKNLWWHIGAAWNRLTVQTLPLFVVAIIIHYHSGQANKNIQNQ